MAADKKKYVTDPKTGKPLSVNPKKFQEAGVSSVGKTAIKLGVKVAQKAIKSATTNSNIKAEAKALKAAKGPSLAKGNAKLDASSGKYERNITKMKAETNQILGSSKKEAYAKAAKAMDKERAAGMTMSQKILARAKAEKIAKALEPKKSNPMVKAQVSATKKVIGAGTAAAGLAETPNVKSGIKRQVDNYNKSRNKK